MRVCVLAVKWFDIKRHKVHRQHRRRWGKNKSNTTNKIGFSVTNNKQYRTIKMSLKIAKPNIKRNTSVMLRSRSCLRRSKATLKSSVPAGVVRNKHLVIVGVA